MRIIRFSLTTMILLILLSACSEEVALLSKLAEQDANEIVGALLAEGLQAQKQAEKDGITVMIDIKDMSRAVKIMKAAGLPNKTQANLGDIFKKEGIISTPLEERARYIYALSQELEFTLSQIDNVILARVHVVLPERVAPGQPIQPSSAAIFIKHLPDLDPDVIDPRIRSMVASSIPGLNDSSANKISVSFLETTPTVLRMSWQKFGPFVVQEDSIMRLQWTFVGCFSAIFLLLVLVISMTWVKSRLWLITKVPLLSKVAV